jgi:hypothetical protein
MNNLLQQRSNGATQTLWSIRKIATFEMTLASLNRQDEIARGRRPVDAGFGIPMGPWLRRTLEALIEKGHEWAVEELGDGQFRVSRGDKSFIVTTDGCDCGFMVEEKLSCKHVLEVFWQCIKAFPGHLIHPRWLGEGVDQPTIPDDLELHLQDELVASQAQSDEESDSEGDETAPTPRGTGDDGQRYKDALYLAKQIAASATPAPDGIFIAVMEQLRGILEGLRPGDIDMSDAAGHRRGRPRAGGTGHRRPP